MEMLFLYGDVIISEVHNLPFAVQQQEISSTAA
jgi:hypothetical protein